MLAELAAGHAIAAAAFVRVIGFDRTQDRTQLLYAGCRFVSKLTGDRFGKGTPQNRRRFEFDARAAGPGHGIQPNHILASARIRADQPRHWLDRGDCPQALITVRRRARYVGGIEIRARGLTKCMGLHPHGWTRFWQRHVLGRGEAKAGTCQPQKY